MRDKREEFERLGAHVLVISFEPPEEIGRSAGGYRAPTGFEKASGRRYLAFLF